MNDKEYNKSCVQFEKGAQGYDGIDRMIYQASVGQVESEKITEVVQAAKDKILEFENILASLDEIRSKEFVGSYGHIIREWKEHLFTTENPGVENPHIVEKIKKPEISLHEFKKISSAFGRIVNSDLVSDLEDIEDGDITDKNEIVRAIDDVDRVLTEYKRIRELPLDTNLIEHFEKKYNEEVEYLIEKMGVARERLSDDKT